MSNREESELAHAVCSLAHSICELGVVLKDEMQWRRSHDHLATKSDLREMENRLMTAFEEIEEFLDAQKTYNDEDAVRVTNIRADIKVLSDKINELLATSGLPDALRTKIGALKTQAQATTADLVALDEANPPPIPEIPVDPNPQPS